MRPKTQAELNTEWDTIAQARDLQLRTGADSSFTSVLSTWIVSHTGTPSRVLDVGCGTGVLAEVVRSHGLEVVGIDPSSASIEIARRHAPEAEYHVATLEQWSQGVGRGTFDLIVANMVLMDVVDLDSFCDALGRVAKGGRVIATITHPAFWPLYWGYAESPAFNYSVEMSVESPFRTASLTHDAKTTHFHRPLYRYLRGLLDNGLTLISVDELRGPEAVDEFRFPRFIGIVANG